MMKSNVYLGTIILIKKYLLLIKKSIFFKYFSVYLGEIFCKKGITRKKIKRYFLRNYNFYLMKKYLFYNIKKIFKDKRIFYR